MDMTLDALEDPDPSLKEFGTGGLANICSGNEGPMYTMETRIWD